MRVAGQRDVGGVALERGAHLLGLEPLGARGEGLLHRAPRDVGGLADHAAALRRQPADSRQDLREGAAAAGVGHPHGLELGQGRGRGDVREGALLDVREVRVGHRPGRVSETPPSAGTGARARWRTTSARRAAPAAATLSDSAPGACGIVTRTTSRPSERPSSAGPEAEPLGPQREHERLGEVGLPRRHPVARHGRHHREALAGGEVGGRDPLEDGDGEGRAHRRAHGARMEGVGRARAEGKPIGPERGAGAHQRPDVAGIGDTGQVDPQRRREAHVAEAAHGRLGQDRDDPRRRREGAGVAHELGRHEIALGQALGRGHARDRPPAAPPR